MPTQRIPDPYATLGVRRGATSSQLRAAYRRLAKRYHPDLQADAAASEQMRRVNQAWEILSSPARRAEYDVSAATLSAATRGHWAGVPRRTPSPRAAAPSWASYGSGPLHRDRESDGLAGPVRWAALLLVVPVAVLSVAILSAGILPFPLLGLLVLVFAGRLFGRDG